MLKKFNWGHGIFLFYTVFVCVLASALIASRGVDHSLVVDDYYAQDIAYQSTYEKTQNSLTSADVNIDYDEAHSVLYLNLHTEQQVSGQVQFYRPSDKTMDFTLELDTALKTVSTADLASGRWVLKIDWKQGTESYYTEEEVFL